MFILAQNTTQFKAIASLAEEIWTEHYTPIIGISQVQHMLTTFQSAEAITQQIQEHRYLYYLIVSESKNIGYFAIQEKNPRLFLSKLYIKKELRGSGFGKKAIGFIINYAKNQDLKKIYLTVNKENSTSITAYKKLGFLTTGTQIIDIGNGFVMNDNIMELVI
ncbi:MAG: hypothetical protein A2Y40_02835 [Candidatus Margulisbacteria bacterium GWF2_35_9]|nr:MAG: hypothetical protein A2Y40_02835 [Candidatus Margulisbacteria bacterium GWF2_35_9]